MNHVESRRQLATFYVNDHLCGIDVSQVQEVTKPLAVTPIYLAETYVLGLINLRGQIATAIDMRAILGFGEGTDGKMSVVSRTDGMLLSLLVDQIGDVIEVTDASAEGPPATLPESVRRFTSGVHKLNHQILTVIDMNKLSQFLNN